MPTGTGKMATAPPSPFLLPPAPLPSLKFASIITIYCVLLGSPWCLVLMSFSPFWHKTRNDAVAVRNNVHCRTYEQCTVVLMILFYFYSVVYYCMLTLVRRKSARRGGGVDRFLFWLWRLRWLHTRITLWCHLHNQGLRQKFLLENMVDTRDWLCLKHLLTFDNHMNSLHLSVSDHLSDSGDYDDYYNTTTVV